MFESSDEGMEKMYKQRRFAVRPGAKQCEKIHCCFGLIRLLTRQGFNGSQNLCKHLYLHLNRMDSNKPY